MENEAADNIYRYLIVDYDRNNFSVSQALFPDTDVAQNLIAIDPPAPKGSRHAFGTRLIAVISCAAVVLAALVAVVAIFILRKRRTQAPVKLENGSQASFTKPELDASATIAGAKTPSDGLQIRETGLDGHTSQTEIDGVERRGGWVHGELHGNHKMPQELPGQTRLPPELAGVSAAVELPHRGYFQREVHELP
jgi:hypothetical protein